MGFEDVKADAKETGRDLGNKAKETWRKADGEEKIMGGIVKEFVPPEWNSTTEQWGPEWPETLTGG